MEKNIYKAGHLRLLFMYLHQNLFNIKKHLALVLKKIIHNFFYLLKTKLLKPVNIFGKLPECESCMANAKE